MVRHNILRGLYEVEKTIGCGGFAKVKLATHLATGEKVAIKIMNKILLGDDLPRVKLELDALKSFSHEHICKLYQVIETDTHFFIIMEYCSGGELFDHIVEKNRLTESDSRMFFRQIVSAVAYLHSQGYAHRDLKPENVLLDKHQHLKLIDFGLCARPEGGVQNPLFTSCGSPTYAAPELVLGKKYLGPEVDVWAMGVLLYALLAGSLPFDDLNIDNLYKKILSGKYDEPFHMSKESRKLIKSMLHVDPKKRITVKELLCHPWLTLGILEPVCVKEDLKSLDEDCVKSMAKYYQVDREVMQNYLKKGKYDYHTATYHLLLMRKKRGSRLRLYNGPIRLTSDKNDIKSTRVTPSKEIHLLATPKEKVNNKNGLELTPLRHAVGDSPRTPTIDDCLSPNSEFLEPRKPSAIRKAQKRGRSPTLEDDNSPVPNKKPSTPGRVTPRTPERKRIGDNSTSTPGSARRVLGSIERSLNRVRHVLTPRKTAETTTTQPVALTNKDLCNVSTTQCKDPEFVINELSKALEKKGIQCSRKGFRLKGSFEPNSTVRLGGCSFELEICYLPNLGPVQTTPTKSILKKGILKTPNENVSGTNPQETGVSSNAVKLDCVSFVGIRRKRLKGDSWCYKRVCEEVLALTATEFRQNIAESAV